MTTKKFDEYYWIDGKKSVEKSAEALRGFNKAAGQFGYNLERMQQAVEAPSYIMPSDLTRMEHLREYFGDWRVEKTFEEY